MRSPRRLSLVLLLLGLVGLTALGVTSAVAVDALLSHPLTDPARWVAAMVGGVAVGCLARFGWTAARHVSGARARARDRQVVGQLELDGRSLDIVRDDRVLAFTSGLLRCQVVVSDTALGRLGTQELRAVAAHEAEHARRRDPLRLLLAASARAALGFVPGAAQAHRRFGALIEMAADERAELRAGRRALAGALLALSQRGGEHLVPAERVDRMLVGRPPRLGLRPATLALDAGVIALIALAATYLTAQTGCLAWVDGVGASARTGTRDTADAIVALVLGSAACLALLTCAARGRATPGAPA